MTLKIAMRFAIVLLAVTLVGIPLHAQTGPSRFDIPFAFLAGGQQMPAGQYAVAFDSTRHVVLRCQRAICGTSVPIAFDTDGAGKTVASRGTLQFEKHGDLYVLRRVRTSDRPLFSELVQSKQELQAVAARHDNVLLASIDAR